MKPADEELELTHLLAAEADGRDHDIALLRGRGPDAAELASLASRLALQGVDVTPPSGAPPAEFPWKKWAIGGGGGASALLLWLALRTPQAVPVTPPSVAPPPEHARAAASHTGAAVETTPSPGSPARTPSPGVTPAPPSATAPSPESPAPISALDATSPSASPPSPLGASSPTGLPTPTSDSQRITPGAPPAAQTSNGSEVVPMPAAAPSEIELLRDARFALKQSPARALELTDQHARLYPGGKLTQERELIAITALVSLGRRTAALSRGAGFERAFPRSPYIEQLNELLR